MGVLHETVRWVQWPLPHVLMCNATYYYADGCALTVIVLPVAGHLTPTRCLKACVTSCTAFLQILAMVLNGPDVPCVP